MVKYDVIYKKVKRMTLRVHDDMRVTVTAPIGYKSERIDSFVLAHGAWIDKKLKRAETLSEIMSRVSPATLRREAEEYFPPVVERLSREMRLKPSKVSISYGKKRLGVCHSDKSIALSYYLMLYPPEVREYVVVHELAHLRHMNHGDKFWALVARYQPNYKALRAKMRNLK